ncbi:TatD family hydrolase [Pseudomonas sp. F1_0610]|uniref:TatD family hydrolase n=1 Tax=Pseudomonas sp. F1_0610 TaxID=3114284 RepID=UPI0039C16197
MIDIGLNLASKRFKNKHELIRKALKEGVKGFILTGTSLEESKKVCQLADELSDCARFTAGFHPHNAKYWDAKAAEQLTGLIEHPLCVAVGECGLDYDLDRMFSSKEEQHLAFQAQLELAIQHNKPVFLHLRSALTKTGTQEILEDFKRIAQPYIEQGLKGVVHCFTDNTYMARELLALGFYLGITGWLTDQKRGADLRRAVELIPLDRLLIETDAPYLLPHNLPERPKDKTNKPEYLPYVLQAVAQSKRVTPEQLETITNDNVEQLFGVRF